MIDRDIKQELKKEGIRHDLIKSITFDLSKKVDDRELKSGIEADVLLKGLEEL